MPERPEVCANRWDRSISPVRFVRRRGRLVSWNIRHGNRSGRRAAAAGGASRIVLWPLERPPRREGGEVVQPPVHKCQSEQSDSILYILLLELCVLCVAVSRTRKIKM